MRNKLSILWIFLVLNFAYCDILALHDLVYLKDVLSGSAGGINFTQGFLLGASVFMEISIGMILVSFFASHKINRLANVIFGILLALAQIASLFVGTSPTMSYSFFSAIEIATLLYIAWSAWNLKKDSK